jgi:hypothetical protein
MVKVERMVEVEMGVVVKKVVTLVAMKKVVGT